MTLNQYKNTQSSKIAFIFNPKAGMKRKILPNPASNTSLEDIKNLLNQYQIQVKYFPTKGPGHATEIAKKCVKDGYKKVLVAGGDGTVGETANGLVGSEVELGILPLGSFMNIARMLSVPLDLEKAVMLIKIGRARKIDVGVVTKMGGEIMNDPYYFLESAGIGFEAEVHEKVLEWERGNWSAIIGAIKTLFGYYKSPAEITIDNEKIKTRATVVNVSNGPYAGAALPIAPKARLNDHLLTVSLYKMTKFELFKYFFKAIRSGTKYSPKLEIHQGKKVRVDTKLKRLVHADARLYGQTPVEFQIMPSALNVITGFPSLTDPALLKRTLLDP